MLQTESATEFIGTQTAVHKFQLMCSLSSSFMSDWGNMKLNVVADFKLRAMIMYVSHNTHSVRQNQPKL